VLSTERERARRIELIAHQIERAMMLGERHGREQVSNWTNKEQQFNSVMSALETGSEYPEELFDLYARLIAAAGFILRKRAGIVDDSRYWSPPPGAFPAFFAGLSGKQRRMIQKMAQGLERVEDESFH
jgi:hypothetical protein